MAKGSSATEGAAVPTWILGPSSITSDDIAGFVKDKWFPAGRGSPPCAGGTTPEPPEGYAVVFRDLFKAGLRFPCTSFLPTVLETFNV